MRHTCHAGADTLLSLLLVLPLCFLLFRLSCVLFLVSLLSPMLLLLSLVLSLSLMSLLLLSWF